MAKRQQFVIQLADRPGSVAIATGIIADAGVNVLAILVGSPQGALQIVTDNPRKTRKCLADAGIRYSEITVEMTAMPNEPGSMQKFLNRLARKGVNIRSAYGSTSADARKAVLVWSAK